MCGVAELFARDSQLSEWAAFSQPRESFWSNQLPQVLCVLLLVSTCSLCVVLSIYDLRVNLFAAKDIGSDVSSGAHVATAAGLPRVSEPNQSR